MGTLKRLFVVFCSFVFLALSAQGFQVPTAQGEFIPVNEVPVGDQLPAAPLLIAAYVFVWLALMFYLWSIWRRLSMVEKEMHALERRHAQRSRT